MEVSFYSLLMSVAWSSFFCILLCLLRKFKKGYLYYNIAPLSILLFGCIFRCILPLDFPGFTQNIFSTNFYVLVDTALYSPMTWLGGPLRKLTPLSIFSLIWLGGTLLLFFTFFTSYFKRVYRLWAIYEEVESGLAYETAVDICKKQKIKRFRIFKDESIHVPYVCGLLYPRVVLPDVEYTATEFRYILGHELAHWNNHDMWVRLITILICYLFWWNPIIYLLLFRMDVTLEFRCDASVVASGCIEDDERLDYLNTILRVIEEKRESRWRQQLFEVQSELVKKRISKEDFQRRIDIIGNYKPNSKKDRRIAIFTIALMAVMLVFSYRFIIQPYFYVEPTSIQEGIGHSRMLPENTYLVENEDGTYSVYVNNSLYMSLSTDGGQQLIHDGFPVIEKNTLEE